MIPDTFSAFDLLDTYINLEIVNPGLSFRQDDNRAPATAPPIIVWHYQALDALCTVFGTSFTFFEPEILLWVPDKPTDWPELRNQMQLALGVDASQAEIKTLAYTLFQFLVKLRGVEAFYDSYFRGYWFQDLPQGLGTDYVRHLTTGILAGLDRERLHWARAILANILAPSGKTFTAAELVAAGYPARSWQETMLGWEDEEDDDDDQ